MTTQSQYDETRGDDYFPSVTDDESVNSLSKPARPASRSESRTTKAREGDVEFDETENIKGTISNLSCGEGTKVFLRQQRRMTVKQNLVIQAMKKDMHACMTTIRNH